MIYIFVWFFIHRMASFFAILDPININSSELKLPITFFYQREMLQVCFLET